MLTQILDTYPHQWVQVDNSDTIQYYPTVPVFVLHLNTTPVRRLYMTTILQKMGISYQLLIVSPLNEELYTSMKVRRATKCTRSETGCALTHLFCLTYILRHTSHSSFIILEDDVIFHREFHARFSHYLAHSDKVDMIMLGSTDFNYKKNTSKYPELRGCLDPHHYVPRYNAYGAHAIYYTRPFAEAWLHHKMKSDCIWAQFDQDFSCLYPRFNVHVCHPSIVMADFSTSHLNHDKFKFSNHFMEKWFGVPSCIVSANYHMFFIDVLDKLLPLMILNEQLPIDYESNITAIFPDHYKWILTHIDITMFSWFKNNKNNNICVYK